MAEWNNNGRGGKDQQKALPPETIPKKVPENYVDEAERIMRSLKNSGTTITTSKIRSLLSLVTDIYNKENTSTEDKKTTNERGTELFPLSFTTVLHSGAGVDVWAEIQSWKALVTKVNYFYLGGKKLGPKLQLRKVAVSNTKVDGKGRLLLATLSFTFKEYDPATTSVKVSTTALNVKASTASKSVKKTTNTAAKKATKKTIKVGDYVKPTGSRYATGQKIPNWVKQRKHRVSQIKSSQNKVLLGHPNGINSWVYLSEVTLA